MNSRAATRTKGFGVLSIRRTIGLSVLIMTAVMMLIFTVMGFQIRNTLLQQELQAVRAQWATLAESTIPALLFDDEQAAAKLLGSLKASPKFTGALLLHPDGRELARYGEAIHNHQRSSYDSKFLI